jgi:hypothetical protein
MSESGNDAPGEGAEVIDYLRAQIARLHRIERIERRLDLVDDAARA